MTKEEFIKLFGSKSGQGQPKTYTTPLMALMQKLSEGPMSMNRMDKKGFSGFRYDSGTNKSLTQALLSLFNPSVSLEDMGVDASYFDDTAGEGFDMQENTQGPQVWSDNFAYQGFDKGTIQKILAGGSYDAVKPIQG